MTRRLKLLFALRLVPLTERNFNLVELGPRGTENLHPVRAQRARDRLTDAP